MIHLATATKTARQVPGDIPDEAFVAALNFEFRNAPTIARHMLMAGTPATLPMIRQRMDEFVVESPYIEAGEDAWRIVATSPTISPQTANDDHKIDLPTAVGEPVLINGCGLEMLRGLPDASIDLALLDLPYGITRTSFDPVIDIDAHMRELRRIITDRGAIVCFATQPFTTKLINAVPDLFKQSLVWEKPQGTGFAQARQRHLKCHEDILIFSKGTVIGGARSKRKMTYNPQNTVEAERVLKTRETKYMADVQSKDIGKRYMALTNCPRSVLRYAKDSKGHSFAKPIALLEYLIRTFSNDNEVVLDHTMGSGSTGVAAMRTGRRFIGAENGFLEDGGSIFEIAKARINAELTGQDNPPPTPPKPRGGKPQKKGQWSAEQRAKYGETIKAKQTEMTLDARVLDKFYTKSEVASACVELLKEHHDLTRAAVIEPSAGAGAFLEHLPLQTVALDLVPASKDIESRDFFDFRPIYLHRNVALVGNPPFGKNASLAIAFFNHAAKIGHTIAMILPRSFRKASVQNKLDSRFHLVAETILPSKSFVFEGQPYDVPCVFQIWRRLKKHRKHIYLPTTHPDFTFTSKEAGEFAVQRVGANAGRIKLDLSDCSQSSQYFIKPNGGAVLETIRQIDFNKVRHDTAGNPSIGKGELVSLYESVLRCQSQEE